ncbi:MAG TPA: phosphatase PAP2 family protein [Actinomycetota bacterium]|nr:phosphatase PAP2 family protein [Actinomycetota bacterium]
MGELQQQRLVTQEPLLPARTLRPGRRRRPSGEEPPLPYAIDATGRYWVVATCLVLVAWVLVFSNFRFGLSVIVIDQAVLERVARARTAWLTDLAQGAHAIGSLWTVRALYWGTVLLLFVVRRFRQLLVLLVSVQVVVGLVSLVAYAFLRPRPLGVQILGDWTMWAHPSRPVAVLSATLVGMVYALLPQGRLRQIGKLVAAGVVVALGLARVYLAVDSPSDILVGAIVGVTIPLVAFRALAPNEAFPVVYRRGRGAHLDVGGRRGEAIHRALEDQLGVQVVKVEPFGLAGSAGSTPLRIQVESQGDQPVYLFGKLYAKTHLRSDRWYKLGRTLRFGRLEDEKPFNTVRRLVQQEDYALRLMHGAGVGSPAPVGVVELTPEREYLVVAEFIDRARELGECEVDDAVVDGGLRIIRRLWDAGLAHRDIKPANLLVRDGEVHLIDVFFTEVRPSPWRQAVDLANMMLVLAVRSDCKRVYQRALREFDVHEIGEAFAATRGITMPSQLRRMIREQGRDLHGDFIRLLPERPHPISIQRWSLRRVLLSLGVLFGGLAALFLVAANLQSAGLL